ncbi:MAG: aspartate/glutamate racemase family protein [Proteobacteria bacterium]|nr:aspartate/glutamate racemase family protein [Pseudomonadota bacterium]
MSTETPARRIGLLIPSSSSTQEPEFARALPPHVTVHAARLPLTKIRDDQTARLVDDIEIEARKLADAEVDVIALPATAPSSRKGAGGDQELIKRIHDATGRPATTASTAMLEALTLLGKRRIALGAPWSTAVNQSVAAFLSQHGYEVVDQQALGHVDNLEVGRLDEQTGYDMGRRVKSQDADIVLLACGNWRTMGVIDRLERELGKPVVTTNQLTLWGALRLAGGVARIDGYGSLLRDHLTARRTAAAE